jgi:uncharacterized repeat protein (TIGR02543 family)
MAAVTTYYLDAVNGNDSNPGTEAQPWKTISKAQAVISAGDTVILRTGDYGNFTDTFADDIISGEPYTYTLPGNTLWTTWKADSGHTPVFSKSGNTPIKLGTSSDMRKGAIIFDGIRIEGPVSIKGVYGVRIKNCEIVGTEAYIGNAQNGVHLRLSGDIVIDNCKIHHSSVYGITAFSGNNNITISNNEIYDTGGDCIGIKSEYRDNSNFLIEGNIIRDNDVWNFPIVHADGIQIDGSGNTNTYTNFVIRNNTFSNVLTSASIIIDRTLASNLIIENNLVYSSAQVLISDTVDMIIRNNTFDTYFRLNRNNSGCLVYNNILLGKTELNNPGDITHNFNITTGNFLISGSVWNESNGLNYANATTAKAALFDTGYQLKATAPAVDFYTGVAATEATPADDILYNSRDLLPDAGCYEYISGPSDITPPSTPQNLSATAISEHQIDLSWDASSDPESGISHYNIYRDGNSIGQSSSTSFSNTGLNSGTTYSYEVSAVNGQGLESGLSNTAQATTSTDTTPPSIVSVSASEASVVITFSESLDTTSAEQTSNYSVNNGVSITAASLDTDTVTLTTSAHTEGSYTLTVINVQDTSGNTMPSTTIDYEYDNGLVAHWKFDDGSGNSAVDSSGNSNTGILVNGPTWTTGKFNGGLSFDGLDDTVEIGTADLNSGAGTIALWGYAVSFAPTTQYLFGHASQPWANRIQLYTDDQEGYLDLGLGNSHSTHTRIHNLDTQRWYHIALNWDGSNYTVYVDGSAQATGAYSGLSMLETYADIGNAGNRANRTEGFNGTIDEVRLYIRALSASEVSGLANTPGNNYTLTITAVGGSVTRIPNQASYGNGTTVTLQATANTGYSFASWSGDASGSSNPTTVVMDGNKSVTANFTIDTYTLGITATNGSVAKTPDQASYNYGTTVTLQATANTGYSFVSWSGDASGTSNPTTVVMNGNKSITANFTINTYTLDITATNGSVAKTPEQASYDHGTTVTLQATANAGYTFASWSGDASGTSNPTTVVMDGNKSITANFTVGPDETAPSVTNLSPQAGSIQASLNTLVTLGITDSGDGVDADSVTIRVNNDTVYSGNTNKYSSAYGECYRTGTKADYTFTYQSNETFDFDQPISLTVNATDLAGNAMDEYSYSFTTEMRSFGENKKVGSDNLNKGSAVTVRDSNGDIWSAWQAGATGSRDIYIGKLAAGAANFSNGIKVKDNSTDQCNPAMAIGSGDKLYVAWQDNRRANWDIYVSTSSDGINWSAETRVTDSNDNQINPAIVVDSSNNAYIVWMDDRNGNQDIYVATSSNSFVTKTISQITLDNSNQVEPAIVVDSDNTVYVVWTDTRNSKNDIYGAASNNGPWTNIPVVTTQQSQSSPAIATEAVGAILHLVWVDDTPADDDIFYAKTSGGLPSSPLTGNSIIDDTSSTDQLRPAIAVSGSTGNNLQVFVCWEDKRNADDDLYFAELGSGSGTNVFVDDDSTNTDQTEPAINIDGDGHPYLVWTDSRNTNTDIYYAGSTSMESDLLASNNISTSSTVTVGTPLNAVNSVDDVSIEVPAGSYPFDIKVTISKITNPLAFTQQCLGAYDFGPSSIEFSQPVTVIIPYNFTGSEDLALAYWYNSLTDELSQQGITDVETIEISQTLHALRFKTTHFTPFYVFLVPAGAVASGGGGGGGCSMSPDSQASAAELLLPYIGLTVMMVVLKLKDKRKRKARNITKSES